MRLLLVALAAGAAQAWWPFGGTAETKDAAPNKVTVIDGVARVEDLADGLTVRARRRDPKRVPSRGARRGAGRGTAAAGRDVDIPTANERAGGTKIARSGCDREEELAGCVGPRRSPARKMAAGSSGFSHRSNSL